MHLPSASLTVADFFIQHASHTSFPEDSRPVLSRHWGLISKTEIIPALVGLIVQ